MNSFPITHQAFTTFYNTHRDPLGRQPLTIGDTFRYYGKKVGADLALVVTTVALPILLLIDILKKITTAAIEWIKPKTTKLLNPLTDFHFLFTSSIFDSYFSQLKDHTNTALEQNYPKLKSVLNKKSEELDSAFQKQTVDLLQHITHQDEVPHNEEKRKEFHQKLLDLLRSAIRHKPSSLNESSDLDKEMISYIESFCTWMYTGANLKEDYIRFMVDETQHNEWENKSWESIQKVYDKLKLKNKFPGSAGSEIDLHYAGDMPTYSYDIQGDNFTTKVIRTPNITYHSPGTSNIGINDEFLTFLDGYKKENTSHLYFNLMRRKEWEFEVARTKTIEQLDRDPKHGRAIHVASFDKDSDFYWQRGETQVLIDSAKFKEKFHTHLFSDYYYWPSKLDSYNWKATCEAVINEIHQDNFKTKTDLSYQERLDFIEIVYTRLFHELLKALPSASCNFTCVRAIDRGSSTAALQHVVESSKKFTATNTKETLAKNIKEAIALAVVPAHLSQSRPTSHYRIDRLKSTLQTLAENQKRVEL